MILSIFSANSSQPPNSKCMLNCSESRLFEREMKRGRYKVHVNFNKGQKKKDNFRCHWSAVIPNGLLQFAGHKSPLLHSTSFEKWPSNVFFLEKFGGEINPTLPNGIILSTLSLSSPWFPPLEMCFFIYKSDFLFG